MPTTPLQKNFRDCLDYIDRLIEDGIKGEVDPRRVIMGRFLAEVGLVEKSPKPDIIAKTEGDLHGRPRTRAGSQEGSGDPQEDSGV